MNLVTLLCFSFSEEVFYYRHHTFETPRTNFIFNRNSIVLKRPFIEQRKIFVDIAPVSLNIANSNPQIRKEFVETWIFSTLNKYETIAFTFSSFVIQCVCEIMFVVL